MPIDARLVAAAAQALGVTQLIPLLEGGQKLAARCQRKGAPVVIKIVRIAPERARVILERARREVALLASVNHPNVVRAESELVEVGNPAQAVAWLEEFLDGEDLSQRIDQPWRWSDARRMAIEVASGLSALHARRAVHRDLSANNIRCLASGGFKIMDPGCARHLERTVVTGDFEPGTPGFMTPEHVAGVVRPVEGSDIFGVGVLMYLVLTGTLPFDPTDRDQYRRQLRDTDAPSVRALRRDLSVSRARVVDTCLQRQLPRRFPTCRALIEALEANP